MSDTADDLVLPPLRPYPQRAEREDRWSDRLETALSTRSLPFACRMGSGKIRRLIDAMNALEERYRELDEPSLRAIADGLRAKLRREGRTDALVVETFALIREASRRHLGLRHHDVQLAGGYALLKGKVAEMDTGEGKTLTATLAAGTAALAGTPVHVITVNDYLAGRDAAGMRPLYAALGLTVGTIVHGLEPAERKRAYACDITYACNKEIAFDYLRDRIALGSRLSDVAMKLERILGERRSINTVMRGLHFAIVDEADSVLIDEARTPLIISRETKRDQERCWAETAFGLARKLERELDYRVDSVNRRIDLSRAGRRRLADLGDELGGVWRSSVRREEAACQALTAIHLFQRGEHYLVKDDKVQIVDEYTGRVMADRSWSEGLHQLIEVKESCAVTARKAPIARITYQRFFRRYLELAGMTGTAREVARELWSVYRLAVMPIPPNLPSRRRHRSARLYASAEQKWHAILARARTLHERGHPVLIGTRSVAASQALSALFREAGVAHEVLNAAQDQREAEIISDAGRPGRVTIATNMAGRGVDIPLDDRVRRRQGLYVILSERHDAKRIDRQLAGRCGRHGEPGNVQSFLSLGDPLLELLPRRLTQLVGRLPLACREPAGLALLRWSQRRAERAHSSARRALLKQDQQLGVLLAFSGGLE